jgi:WD40 repeat protein
MPNPCACALLGYLLFCTPGSAPGQSNAPRENTSRLVPCTDIYGDALPDGAVARLGTLRWRTGDHVGFPALTPDGAFLITNGPVRAAHLWDARTGKVIRTFQGHTGPATRCALSPDGNKLATSGEDKTVRLWQVATGKELWRRKTPEGWAQLLCYTPDGRTVVGAGTGFIRRWSTETGKDRDHAHSIR